MPEINPTAIIEFCRVVWRNHPAAGLIALRGLPEKGRGNPPYLVWLDPRAANWLAGVVDFVETCNLRQLAAYCIPGHVRGHRAGHADVVALQTVVVDIDRDPAFDIANKAIDLLGTPSLCVQSGGRTPAGAPCQHLWWRLDGETTPDRVCVLRSLAARIAGADDSFGPGRAHQPIRIAGSVHRKRDPVAVSIAYGSENVLQITDAERRLQLYTTLQNTSQNGAGSAGRLNGGPDDSAMPRPNSLGLSRQVSLDELVGMQVGHGEPRINRFEALTRMAGMLIHQIADADDAAECEREFEVFRQWARTHIENVERDYRLIDHWRKLLARERWKRRQPRQTFRRQARSRNF